MSKKIIAVVFLLLAAGTIIGVRAAVEPYYYLPIVIKQSTPTPTQTQTPTTTSTPTKTPTPTPTPTPEPGVYIIDIVYDPSGDPLDEYVSIKNHESKSVDMTDWILRDENQNVYTFPTFTLSAGATVKVWTKSGTNTSSNLYWGSSVPIWNDHGDCGYLRDDDNNLIDAYCYAGSIEY